MQENKAEKWYEHIINSEVFMLSGNDGDFVA